VQWASKSAWSEDAKHLSTPQFRNLRRKSKVRPQGKERL